MTAPTSTRFAVATHVLTYLASRPDELISSDRLAASTRTNPVHVRRLLRPLRAAGLVRSRPGPRGGWLLGLSAGDISLADVWLVLQGDDTVLGHHLPTRDCPVGRGIQDSLLAVDRDVATAIRTQLQRTTIADLLTPAMVSSTPLAGPEALRASR